MLNKSSRVWAPWFGMGCKAQTTAIAQLWRGFATPQTAQNRDDRAARDLFSVALKGALLFTLWYDMPHRATRDADLLGFGPGDKETVAKLFRDIAAVEVDDGIVFDPSTVSVQDIRKEAGYGGVRVLLTGTLARARCPTQVDVGFGDAVTPAPVEAIYPVLLGDMPAPRLRTYPACTVVAEKLHAIAVLGMTNSRLKDYLDLSVLLEREALDPVVLAAALAATFSRRGTVLPATLPAGLSEEFAHDASRNALWRAFLKKNELIAPPLAEVVAQLHLALWPALTEAAALAGLPQPDTPN